MSGTSRALSAEERATIARYLSELTDYGQYTAVSSHIALLRDARRVAGRDLDSGMLRPEVTDEDRADWPALLLYLILLEQIGTVLRRKGTRALRPGENTLRRTIQIWEPTVRWSHAEVLRTLRNALAHDFGLTARDERKPRRGRPVSPPLHHRRFGLRLGGPIVVLPRRRWNGEYSEASRGGIVWVNHQAVGDLSERIVASIRKDQAILRLNISPEEYRMRFGFRVTTPSV
jgi:hypothetical protein